MNDWNPQPVPQDVNQIEGIIHSLKEGTSVFFCQDKITGHQGNWTVIECVSNGDEFTYFLHSRDGGKRELEDENDVKEAANEIFGDAFKYFDVQSIQGYKKSHRHYEDDQDVGHYEKFGPDQPTWADVQEGKKTTMKPELLECIIRECAKELLGALNESSDEDHICAVCNGSGEGQHDGSRCLSCGGSGNKNSKKKLTKRTDPDYEYDPEDRLEESGKEEWQHPKIKSINKGIEMGRDPNHGKTADIDWTKRRLAQLKKDYPNANLNEDETEGAPAPPADGQGTAEQPEIPKEKDTRPETPSKKQTPKTPLELDGVVLVDPTNKSNLKKVPLKAVDDATLERLLHRLAAGIAGSKVKISLSTMRLVKDTIKNPKSATYLYVGKTDPESDDLYLMADKSLEVAKDATFDPAGAETATPTLPDNARDPLGTDADYVAYMANGGRTKPDVDENLRASIKAMVNKLLEGDELNELGMLPSAQKAADAAQSQGSMDPEDPMTSAEKAKLKHDNEHTRQQQIKQKQVELDTKKREVRFNKTKLDQQTRFDLPQANKELQRLKGAQI